MHENIDKVDSELIKKCLASDDKTHSIRVNNREKIEYCRLACKVALIYLIVFSILIVILAYMLQDNVKTLSIDQNKAIRALNNDNIQYFQLLNEKELEEDVKILIVENININNNILNSFCVGSNKNE